MRLFLLTLLTACSILAANPPQKPPAKPAPPAARPQTQDAEIEKAIRARFAKSKIATNNFQVKVQGGVATLDGSTNVIQHKGTATRLAKLAGARQVVNHIKISDAARQKAADQLAGRRAVVKRGE